MAVEREELKPVGGTAWQRVKAAIRSLDDLGGAMTALAVVVMCLLIGIATIARYVFRSPFVFEEEYSAYLMIVIAYCGLAVALKDKAHISIEIVADKLGVRSRALVDAVTSLITFIITCVLLYYAVQLVQNSLTNNTQASTVMLTPLWIPQTVIVVGLIMFILELLVQLVTNIVLVTKGSSESESAGPMDEAVTNG